MANFEFINYTATPGEKHLGIATIKMYGKLIARFKIIANKDGRGIFPAPACYKMTDETGERWIDCLMVDSRSEHEEMETVIRHGVKKALQVVVQPIKMESSVLHDECPF